MRAAKYLRTRYLEYVITINSYEGKLWRKIISFGPKLSEREHLRRLDRARSLSTTTDKTD